MFTVFSSADNISLTCAIIFDFHTMSSVCKFWWHKIRQCVTEGCGYAQRSLRSVPVCR